MPPKQLPLDVRLRESASFDNFQVGRNAEVVQRVRALAESPAPRACYVWGSAGTGKTHLLQAACRLVGERGHSATYVPLDAVGGLGPGLLDGLEAVLLVCVDDIQAVAGNRDWETALFTLTDRLRDAGVPLVVAGNAGASGLGLAMPELTSRLVRDLVYPLLPLDDSDKLTAMRRRAAGYGCELPEAVARYMLSRYARDTTALFDLLERLDRAALAGQQPITIPLVRKVMGEKPQYD